MSSVCSKTWKEAGEQEQTVAAAGRHASGEGGEGSSGLGQCALPAPTLPLTLKPLATLPFSWAKCHGGRKAFGEENGGDFWKTVV